MTEPSSHPASEAGASVGPEPPGTVYLVGAGPGDPGLLALRGQRLLSIADCVLYDGLAHPDLLRHAPQAELLCVGKHGSQQRLWRQEEINAELIARARAGQRVVRLKAGDPAVFARTGEEVVALREAAIPFEIVPGITAALAASAYAGIPLTDRRWASAVALVTGHEEANKPQSALDWEALARFPGTLVIYMGVTQVAHWTKALLDGGLSPQTPVAIIRRCSWPDQQTLSMTLDQVAAALTPASRLRPPVIAIIGPAADPHEIYSWFEQRPLFQRTVLVTRPEMTGEDELATALGEFGARILHQPVIALSPPTDWAAVDQAIDRLATYKWIVFTSRMGIETFFRRLAERGFDARAFAGTRIACVGPGTANALTSYGLRADLIPDEYQSDSLATALLDHASGTRVLWLRASRGREAPLQRLMEAAHVDAVVTYFSQDVDQLDPTVQQAAVAGSIDWVTVTSSASARSLVRLLGDALHGMRLASLSESISQTLRELGFPPSAQAAHSSLGALAQAIAEATRNSTDR
jgi:uroporphyrinogen III methyltransferase/synthase